MRAAGIEQAHPSTDILKATGKFFNDWLCGRPYGRKCAFQGKRPRAKEGGQAPRGAARKGRAYLTGKRFGISKIVMIISATGRCCFFLFNFEFRLKHVDRRRIQRVLEMDGIVLFNHFNTGTAVLGDLINICPLH
jgi:hypothetical protein